MKKIIPISLVAIALVALVFSFIKPTEKLYLERPTSEHKSGEPYFMEWAKVDLRTGERNPSARTEALTQLRHSANRAGTLDLKFENKGPDNVGGRTRAILEIHGEPDKLLVGSVSGGLFMSNDAGSTWEPHAQFQNLDESSSMISCMHQDTNNGRIYVGTGCVFDDEWPGYGVYYSDDMGETFTHLESTTPDSRYTSIGGWTYVHRIRTDGNGVVYAATNLGLMRSADKGATWEEVMFSGSQIPVGIVSDVLVQPSGKVYASTRGCDVFISDNGTAGSFERIENNTNVGLPSTGGNRTVLAGSAQDENHVYILVNNSNSCLTGVYETTNGGVSWSTVLAPFDNFKPMYNGQYCQGTYDAALGVSPLDDGLFFLGGITLWRYDGNLTRIASEFGSPPFQDVFPNYVHADKHYVYFSPNDPNRVYITSDGGIAMSENKGATWKGLNKGYYSTQFYGVAYSNDGVLQMGGTQDNGTLIVTGDNSKDPKVGFQATGGDGFLCEISQISRIAFSTSQNGVASRIDASQIGQNVASGLISGGSGNVGPFRTVVRLWENPNDLTSKDSVIFSVERLEQAIAVSNGVVKTFTANVVPVQPAAIVIGSSIEVYAGTQELSTSLGDSINLTGSGSTGTVGYNADGSFDITVNFATAPPENSNVYVSFEQRFNVNSVLYLESENLRSGLTTFIFEHRLENNLYPGDIIKIQDPVQSLLANSGGPEGTTGGGIRMYRNAMDFLSVAEGINIPGVSGMPSCVEFTQDGNHAFVGMQGGTIYRISGLQNLYTEDDVDQLTVSSIFSTAGGTVGAVSGITDISIDPNDNSRLLVSAGGFGLANRVWLIKDALSPSPLSTNIHGDLPTVPVYSCEIDRNNPNIALLGTDFGIWATDNLSDPVPTWSDENSDISYIPVYSIRQQRLPFSGAKNTGVYFIGSYGRGFWQSSSLVGIEDVDPLTTTASEIRGLRVYPNPIKSEGKIEFESSVAGNVTIVIYDLNGRKVKTWNERVTAGTNKVVVNAANMRSGNYIATVESGNSRQVAKIMVLN